MSCLPTRYWYVEMEPWQQGKCDYTCAFWRGIHDPLLTQEQYFCGCAPAALFVKTGEKKEITKQKNEVSCIKRFAKIAQPQNRIFCVGGAWGHLPNKQKRADPAAWGFARFWQVSGHLPCLLLLTTLGCPSMLCAGLGFLNRVLSKAIHNFSIKISLRLVYVLSIVSVGQ